MSFQDELKKNINQPNVVIEITLDSGVIKWGYHTGGFSDTLPILKSVSSLQNKIDPKTGYTTRGQITFVISGRAYIKSLVKNNYLKNRRIIRKDGFVGNNFIYTDYLTTFNGKISDWSRKDDELVITASDDLYDALKKVPVENSTKTQYISYQNQNPIDIMKDILSTQLAISASYINTAKFDSERDLWLSTWKFARVITEPKAANEYLNELQIETNSFILHDGEKITFKVFAPAVPGQAIEEWSDNFNILDGSLSCESGYKDNFYNRVVLYYDYDESGSNGEENYGSALISIDAASQASSQWNEATTKVIKSKWIRSLFWTQPTTITGVIIYHVSAINGAGSGTLTFNYTNNTLQWAAFGEALGEAVKLSKDGKIQIFSADKAKYCRVLVTRSSLPTSNKTDAISVTSLNVTPIAITLTQKLLVRYRDPVSSVTFTVDLNNLLYNNAIVKPSDYKDVTTDDVFEKGKDTWVKERLMLTSIRPDFEKATIDIEAIQTRLYKRYGFIAPAGYPDYPTASASQREYGFIGDVNNKVNAGAEDGYYIW